MNKDIVTLPKKGLKTRHCSKDMNMDNKCSNSTQKGLKDKTL